MRSSIEIIFSWIEIIKNYDIKATVWTKIGHYWVMASELLEVRVSAVFGLLRCLLTQVEKKSKQTDLKDTPKQMSLHFKS